MALRRIDIIRLMIVFALNHFRKILLSEKIKIKNTRKVFFK